jgi:hypothetical protein
MEQGKRYWRLGFLAGLIGAVGGAGCFIGQEDVDGTEDEINAGADVSQG